MTFRFFRRVASIVAIVGVSFAGNAADVSKNPNSRMMTPNAASAKIQLPPKLEFGYVAYSPSPTKVGATLSVSPQIVNKGDGESGPDYKFTMTCTVISGGACPIASTGVPIAIPSLPAGGQKSFSFVSAQQAQKGSFKLSFAILNNSMQSVAKSEINISVQ